MEEVVSHRIAREVVNNPREVGLNSVHGLVCCLLLRSNLVLLKKPMDCIRQAAYHQEYEFQTVFLGHCQSIEVAVRCQSN